MNTHHQTPPPVQMMHFITGFWTSCCIYNAAKLGIADELASTPRTPLQLAERTHTHAPSLYRVLRALASVGIFQETPTGEFVNTPLSETLRSDTPGSLRAMSIAQLGDHYDAWGNLLYTIKTGNTSFDKVEGMSVWKYYETHPDEGLNFIQAMSGLTRLAIVNVLPAYDFTQCRTIVDLGGGNGAFLKAILGSAPEAKGIVFDEEYVVAETEKELAASGFAGRCTTRSGSFFEFVPEDADTYVMKMVLHDWNDEQSVTILTNCARAMTAQSKLLIVEAVIPAGNEAHPGKFMDINMLAMTGGKERTEKEFAELISKSGLTLRKVIHTQSPMLSILEVTK